MGFFSKLFGPKGWDNLPSVFVQNLKECLGDQNFALLDSLARKYNIFNQKFFKEMELLAREPNFATDSFAMFLCNMAIQLGSHGHHQDSKSCFFLSTELSPTLSLSVKRISRNMNIPPFKGPFTTQALADLLYEDVFSHLTTNISIDDLRERFIDIVLQENQESNTKLKSEWFSLVAFLVTFTFQREFNHLRPEANKFILDCFHDRLFDNISENTEDNTFPQKLKARYNEYYPLMKEDLICLGLENAIPFKGIIESFFNKIASDELSRPSPDIFPFSLFLAKLYSLLLDTYDKIKKYEIS